MRARSLKRWPAFEGTTRTVWPLISLMSLQVYDVWRRAAVAWIRSSRIVEERLEAKIHVLLNVAMKESEPGLVGDEVDCRASEEWHDDCVFHDAGGGLAV